MTYIRDTSGRIQLDGIRLSTYELHLWIIRKRNQGFTAMTPKTLTEVQIREFVNDVGNKAYRHDLPRLVVK